MLFFARVGDKPFCDAAPLAIRLHELMGACLPVCTNVEFHLVCFRYAGMTNAQVVITLGEGKRLSKPSKCSDDMFELLLDCWEEAPASRPSFGSLVRSLDALDPIS